MTTPATTASAGGGPAVAWHAVPRERMVTLLGGDARRGLDVIEAHRRLQQHGANELPAAPPPGLARIALHQLHSPLVYVLLAAGALALVMGQLTDAAFIAFVLLVNSAIGTWQEWQAERQSRGLQSLLRVRATVIRDGVTREIEAAEVVPGDLVVLTSGQFVPADARLIDSRDLEIDESLLTGESLPAVKDAAVAVATEAVPADRRNCAFAGTAVLRGRAQGLVFATGGRTEVGRLAGTMATTAAGKPPLTERMERFSRTIAVVVVLAAVTVAAFAVLVHGQSPFTMFSFGVALAVSAIPEGLPVAVTIALAIAARRMAARGAIVRQLPAVEGLGSCSLIASDKTGTLTCNALTVCAMVLHDGSRWDVGGVGHRPVGAITRAEDGAGDDAAASLLAETLRIGAACNEAQLLLQDGEWSATGDPTDIALLVLAAKGGLDRDALLRERPLVAQRPYEPELQYAATAHRVGDGTWIAAKGAPERMLPMCEMADADRLRILESAGTLARAGYRVLALASASRASPPATGDAQWPPRGLEFAALVGLIDPLRDGAAEAVARCVAAGIRVVMVTGDHPLTALSIARDLGIAASADDIVLGADVVDASPQHLREVVGRARVFARVTPEQKLAIVAAAQAGGQYVAVTGDGVNDAPALHRANIGIAMGRGGTDIARDAADLVLSDDDFSTIVAGIEEGRVAYQNIRNVVYLLTAAGIAEVLTVGVAVLAGLPLPLLPVQLLWLNLVTNGIQDVGLAFERGAGDELRRPPRPRQEPVFDRLMLERGLLAGLWMSTLGLGWFGWLLQAGASIEQARNSLLLLMVLMQNVDAINARSETIPVLRLPMGRNPLLLGGVFGALGLHVLAMHAGWLQRTLDVMPVARDQWLVLPLFALSLLVVMELQKAWRQRRNRSSPG